jgi:hypothetical protein
MRGAMGPKSYRGEITMRGRIDRTAAYESRELAAAALPRLLGSQHWQYRLSHAEPLPSCTVRMVEVEKPADVHPFAGVSLEDFSEALRRRLYDQVVADYFAPEPMGEEGATTAPLLYNPDAAGLTVFHLQGRWFVAWNRLELQGGTEEDRSTLLRIYSTERGIVYQEV